MADGMSRARGRISLDELRAVRGPLAAHRAGSVVAADAAGPGAQRAGPLSEAVPAGDGAA